MVELICAPDQIQLKQKQEEQSFSISKCLLLVSQRMGEVFGTVWPP